MEIREPSSLGSLDESLVPLLEGSGLDLLVDLDNVLELVQEPLVNLGQVVELVDSVAKVEHRVGDGEKSSIGVVGQGSGQVLGFPVGVETGKVGVDLSDSLLQRLLEGSSDGHDLTDRLHGGSDVSLDVLELGQVPLGDLGDNVVERGLETGRGGLGDSVRQLGESVAKSNLSGGVGERVSSGLGGEGADMSGEKGRDEKDLRRSRETSVHLNDSVVSAVGVQGVLHVALSDNSDVSDNLNGSRSEHVVLVIREGLGGSDDDGVTGVCSERVKVLHVAADDGVIGGVSHDLVLDLLPSLQTLLNEDLRGEGEGLGSQVSELLLVVRESGSETSQGEGGSEDDGVADLGGGVQGSLDGGNSRGLGGGDVDLCEDERCSSMRSDVDAPFKA